jgi:hypothetical protein
LAASAGLKHSKCPTYLYDTDHCDDDPQFGESTRISISRDLLRLREGAVVTLATAMFRLGVAPA